MLDIFVLYLHIASAVLLMGSTLASRLAEGALRGAPNLATLRGSLDVVHSTTRFNPPLAMILLISGAYLGEGGWWSTMWFWVAVATWFSNLLLAVRFVVPGHQSLGIAAAQAGDGQIPAAIDALRRAVVPAVALDVMIGLDFGTLLIMVFKPDGATAWLWPLLCVAASCAIRFARNLYASARTAPTAAARASSRSSQRSWPPAPCQRRLRVGSTRRKPVR
ncbi:MAG TPA: hypothetical protein VIT02_02870 [Burkholderiaceae bacterium]